MLVLTVNLSYILHGNYDFYTNLKRIKIEH